MDEGSLPHVFSVKLNSAAPNKERQAGYAYDAISTRAGNDGDNGQEKKKCECARTGIGYAKPHEYDAKKCDGDE